MLIPRRVLTIPGRSWIRQQQLEQPDSLTQPAHLLVDAFTAPARKLNSSVFYFAPAGGVQPLDRFFFGEVKARFHKRTEIFL